MFRKAILPFALLLVTGISACAQPGYYYGRVAPPPPPRYRVIGYAPAPGYIWAEGFWDLRGGRWVWAPGRWMRPPRYRAAWVPAYWAPRGRGYYFVRGRWR